MSGRSSLSDRVEEDFPHRGVVERSATFLGSLPAFGGTFYPSPTSATGC